jgi:site-specific DNA recombinase
VEVKRLDELQKDKDDESQKPRRETHDRALDETIPVSVPAIIPRELWEAAQAKLSERRARCHKPTRYEYLLRGRLRCAHCGGARVGLTYEYKRGPTSYYRCRNNSADRFDRRCPAGSARADEVDPVLWKWIKKAIQDDEVLFTGMEEKQARAEKAQRMIRGAIAGLEAQNAKAQAKLDRLLDLYTEGGLTKTAYLFKCEAVKCEVEKRNTERGKLEEQLKENQPLTTDQRRELMEFRQNIALGIENATFAERVHILDLLDIQCIYDDRTRELSGTGVLGAFTLSNSS